jgi:CRP-like cAMP-binding protein
MYFEGENSRELYLIKTGKVSLTKNFGIQNQIVVDSVSDGEFFGLVAAIKGAARSETATVSEDAYIYSLKPGDFNELIAKNLRIGFKLFSTLANTLRNYNQKIERLTFRLHSVEGCGGRPRKCGDRALL